MVDAKFMTATEKELVLKQWTTFVKHGFKFEHFTDRIYKHLTLHCSFIAHFNRLGFYETYFIDHEDTLRFLGQFDKDRGCNSVEYGGDYWINHPEMSDLNQALIGAVEPYLKDFYKKLVWASMT